MKTYSMKLSRWIPQDGRKVEVKNLPGTVAYLYTSRKGQPSAIFYRGNSNKVDMNVAYRSEEQRTKGVTAWVQECIRQHENRMAHKAIAQEKKHADAPQIYLPGCIICHSWGYDQTNIDFFIITERKGDMVTLQALGQDREYNSQWMTGTTTPIKDKPIGEPFKRKVHKYDGEETGISIEKSYGWASLWNGKPVGYTSYA
jgi:hypothetical protein